MCRGKHNHDTFLFMPATTSLFINKHSPNSKGECSVSVRVTFERQKKYYPTGKSLSVSDFNKILGKVKKEEDKEKININIEAKKETAKETKERLKELSLKLHAFEKKAADIIEKLPYFSFNVFEKHYFTNRGTKDSITQAFIDYSTQLREAGRIGTAVSYECAQNSLNKFIPDAKFADITPTLLSKYESWMLKEGKSITTVGIYLRSLRTLFNNAIAEGLLTKDFYPFGKKRYEIPTGNNIKKALTLKDIGSIYHYKPEKGSTAERAKDYWIFMYLCNGMNVKDMSLLKYENIKSDVLEFIRAKTARTKRKVEPIRVVLTDDVKAIIKKWGNKKIDGETFIFPILVKDFSAERERQLIQQLTGVINDHMKAIADKLEIDSDCTTYAARHSFSTVLQRSGVSTEFISEALGHSSVKTTANYLAGFEDESKRETIKALTAF